MKNFKKHVVKPDPLYGNVLIQMLINNIMLDGKKEVAQKIVYSALKEVEQVAIEQYKYKNISEMFDAVVAKIRPITGLKSKRIGGSNYSIPYEIPEIKSISKGMKAMRDAVRNQVSKNGINSVTALKKELLAIFNDGGECIKQKETGRKMAESNRSNAHMA